MTPAETLVASIAAQSFSGLLSNLASHYLTRKTRSLSQPREALTTDLRKHFEVTFDKCLNVKTIINDFPVNILSIYVDQRFEHRRVTIDQYTLIESIRQGRSVVITGTGGGGKSMFMRYIWLSFFEKSDGKILLFFDLRQVNSVSHKNFADYLFHTIVQSRSTISQQQFELAINRGEIVLFLDGFDEISLERRADIERQIIALKELNPRLVVVVTSRPDERFAGWQQFDSVSVLPLDEESAKSLIERAIYDEASKSRLLKRLKAGLYSSHRSFLSNPLLAYMMLLTIARNPDIPNRMHAFYEMAFDALYHRHDTSKGGYVREFHSRVDKHLFTKYLSYFCLITYHDECYEANEHDILNYIGKAIRFDGSEEAAEPLLRDMVESICILRKDGLLYTFIHRSFQEYFAALCICRYASRNLEKLFSELSHRYNDQVLRMVYDINPDLFREKYLLPIYGRHKRYLKKKTQSRLREEYLSQGNLRFEARNINPEISKRRVKDALPGREVLISLDGSGEIFALIQIVGKITSASMNEVESPSRRNKRNLDELFFLHAMKQMNVDQLDLVSDGETLFFVSGDINLALDYEQMERFKQTYMYEYLGSQARKLKSFMEEEVEKYSIVTSSFDEYF